MDALFVSTLAVAVAEIGDKTQLLALVLAARYRKSWPIIAGILAATLLNHALAGWFGSLVTAWVDPTWLRWGVALSFLAVAAWALVPDKLDEDEVKAPRFGPFVATLIAFFIVEIGDKTQVATIALGAQFQDVLLVALGTTAGMMLANVPAVWFGQKIVDVVPLKVVRSIAAALFLAIGLWVIAQAAGWLGGLP